MQFSSSLSLFKKYGAVSRAWILKHRLWSGVILVAVAGVIYFSFRTPAANTTTVQQDIKVARKPIIVDVSGTGAISPINTVDIKTKGSGDIRAITVQAGDTVKQGTPLVRLDSTDAMQQVNTAKVNLQQAELDLEKIKEPADKLAVLQVEDQIAAARQAIKDQDTAVANAHTTLLNASLAAIPETQVSTVTPPTISGTYLGDQEGEMKVTPYMSGNGLRFSVTGLATGDGVASTLTPQPLGDSGLYILFSSTDAQPNWIISIPNTRGTTYTTAYAAYQNALITRQKTDDAQNRTIAELQLQLDKLNAGADDLDIRSKELVVDQRKNDLAQAYANLADYTAAAPFDGVIASITAEVGDNVNQSTSLGTIITKKKIAEVSLNEVDVTKVSVGQKATLTFDAVDGLSVSGTIAEIDTLGTTSQGVVTYKVKIVFDDKDERIKPGMTVSADIILDQKDDALTVPAEAVKTIRGKKYVLIPDPSATGKTKQVEVTTGLSNDKQVEITSGLQEGDTIVITRKVSGTTTQAPSLIGGTGNRGGAGRGF